ncbi:MAG: hypothetical protein FD143_3203, partial [Ignavibacteria bacterium]
MTAMSNRDINKILTRFSQFLGVFPADINPLLNIHSFPCCFIMNTKPKSEQTSGHWL